MQKIITIPQQPCSFPQALSFYLWWTHDAIIQLEFCRMHYTSFLPVRGVVDSDFVTSMLHFALLGSGMHFKEQWLSTYTEDQEGKSQGLSIQ